MMTKPTRLKHNRRLGTDLTTQIVFKEPACPMDTKRESRFDKIRIGNKGRDHVFPFFLFNACLVFFPIFVYAAEPKPETNHIRIKSLPGQTAILWSETVVTERELLVYDEPIDELNRSKAKRICDRVHPGSANDWFEDSEECPRAPENAQRGWILDSNEKPLNRNDGLFVYTHKTTDPENLYFAVVGKKEKIEPGRNATVRPIRKNVAPLQPIPQSTAVLEDMAGAAKGLPVVLCLHSHQGRPVGEFTHLFFGNENMGWREGLPFKFIIRVRKDCIVIEPYDRVWINRRFAPGDYYLDYYDGYRNIESWWYGSNNQINLPLSERKNDYMAHYTERWLLYIVDWVTEKYEADPMKIYATGASMGTGVLRLALHNPERFALVDALVPFFDLTFDDGKQSLKRRYIGLWGTVDVKNEDGGPISDRVNLVRFMQRTKSDVPFLIIRVGRQDGSVYWRSKPAFFKALEDGRHGFLAGWDNGNHSTAMRKPIPEFPNFRDVSWYSKRFALDKSFPAINRCSLDSDYGNGDADDGDPVGFLHRGIDWEVLEDAKTTYRIRFFCTIKDASYPVTFDMTPRRLRQFRVSPGEPVTAKTSDVRGDDTRRLRADVDSEGLVTVESVSLDSAEGVILTIEKGRAER